MTQQSIINALQRLSDPRAVNQLVAQMHLTTSPLLRMSIIKTLIAIGDSAALSDITRYANDPDHHVREWVKEARERLSTQ